MAIDPLPHLVGAHGAVLIVEAVGGAVGGGDIELHQVDVLADDVGRRLHLEIVLLVFTGSQVGVVEIDAVVAVGPDEERLRGLGAVDRGLGVSPQGQNARLGKVLAQLVELHVELDDRGLVDPVDTGGSAVIGAAGIGKGGAGSGGHTVGQERWRGCRSGQKGWMGRFGMKGHPGPLRPVAVLGHQVRLHGKQFLVEIERRNGGMAGGRVGRRAGGATTDDVARQSAIVEDVEGRGSGTVPGFHAQVEG